VKIVRSGEPEFLERVKAIQERRWLAMDEWAPQVESIIKKYREFRDLSLLEFAKTYDGIELKEEELWVSRDAIRNSHKKVSSVVRKSIEVVKARMERVQSEMKVSSFQEEEEAGVLWGAEVRPLDRVGIYVPGMSANYFITLLQCAVPARVAGVKKILVATPPRKKLGPPYIEPTLLYAAKLCEITDILVSGGTGALAALAFGSKQSEPVNKIVGAGSVETAVAKQRLSGYVGIDGFTGTLETAFICDRTTKTEQVVADVIGRADLDPQASFFIFNSDENWIQNLLDGFVKSVDEIKDQRSQNSVKSCLERNLTCFLVRNLDESFSVVNDLAPALLCVCIKNASDHLDEVRSCGSVLLGQFTPPVALDIIGGPLGIVSTMGAASFALSMSPGAFVKRFPVMEISQSALERLHAQSRVLAKEEGYSTHEAAFEVRLGGKPSS